MPWPARVNDKKVLMKAGEPARGRRENVFFRLWIVLLPVTALLAAGCGGGSGDASSAATAGEGASAELTKAELIEQGDAICAKAYAVMQKLNPEGTPKEAVRVADLTSDMVERLLDLGNPQRGAEFSYGEYIHAANGLVHADAAVKSTAERDDPNALKDAAAASLLALSTFQNWANEFGLKGCDLVAYLAAEDSSQAP